MKTLSELMTDYEPERLAACAADLAIHDLPENVAARAAKSHAEFQRGIMNGWHGADGEPVQEPEDAK